MTPPRRRAATSTSNFGVGRRESHVADAFYARFEAPELSADEHVTPHEPGVSCILGDARHMDAVADDSVALVVTSPPYFAGKQYEEELGREGVPGSYIEYLGLLRDVFADCKRVLEPGGRIAVNVANLGRKPYRSLAADVMAILQDDLHLLPRGEVVWQKGEGANGSCAWGSFRSAANPVLRDVTERVVIASKGRFNRARSPKDRRSEGLPYESTIGADDFMALTLDVWDVPPESAVRVQHPAPFPIELPQRLMELYTYRGDLVVDPFCGSGTTLVAAVRSGRDAVGYDLDPVYVELARARLAGKEAVPVGSVDGGAGGARDGTAAPTLARDALASAGFSDVRASPRLARLGLTLSFSATDAAGRAWYFDVAGANSSFRGGMAKSETVWRALGRAHVMAAAGVGPLVVLTTQLPRAGTEADRALRAAGPGGVFDVVDLLSPDAAARLAAYAVGRSSAPLAGFWAERDVTPGAV
ncbi:MAG TPA: site-specific DNA-methyltransferase [Acidimicrobiales bacterium]|jgi:site-specific DNA-methyltransferase (adenine-specific)|nr:site-specific DNA-methyltransferase [Acidimicrobiales bacterium]